MELLSYMMIEDGVISRPALATAIEQQVLTGEQLPDVLLDLNYVEEKIMVHYLSKRYKMPGMTSDEILPSEEVITCLTKESINAHQIFPVEIKGRQLTLAVVNPKNRRSVMEASSQTGKLVKTVIITKRTWEYLVEKYIGLLRPKLKRYSADKSVLKEKDVTESVNWVTKQLQQAENQEMVTWALIEFFGSLFDRVVFLLVRKESLIGWDGILDKGTGRDIKAIRQISNSLMYPSAFKQVIESKAPYLGPLRPTQGNLDFLGAIGKNDKAPTSVYIAPIIIRNKVRQLIYLDRGPGKHVPSNLAEITIVLSKVSELYERFIRENLAKHVDETNK